MRERARLCVNAEESLKIFVPLFFKQLLLSDERESYLILLKFKCDGKMNCALKENYRVCFTFVRGRHFELFNNGRSKIAPHEARGN